MSHENFEAQCGGYNEDEFAKIEGTTEIQQWKVELLELRKLVEKVYNADAEANDGKVKVFLK